MRSRVRRRIAAIIAAPARRERVGLAPVAERYRDYSTGGLDAESVEMRRLERAHAAVDSAVLSSARRM